MYLGFYLKHRMSYKELNRLSKRSPEVTELRYNYRRDGGNGDNDR